jgi:hypothetical protein
MLAKLFSFWASPPGRPAVLLLLSVSLALACPQTAPNDLTQMNTEDLMNVEVTSVSGHEQSLQNCHQEHYDFAHRVNSSLMPRGAYPEMTWDF